jgi:hypothetical protein
MFKNCSKGTLTPIMFANTLAYYATDGNNASQEFYSTGTIGWFNLSIDIYTNGLPTPSKLSTP